jgi:hypothetical protein
VCVDSKTIIDKNGSKNQDNPPPAALRPKLEGFASVVNKHKNQGRISEKQLLYLYNGFTLQI